MRLSKTRLYTLDTHDVREIGLYELASRGSSPPSLKIGRIIACCQIEGLIPKRRIRLNKEARAEIMGSPPRLSASFKMPSRPGALLFSSFVTDARTSSYVMSVSQYSGPISESGTALTSFSMVVI